MFSIHFYLIGAFISTNLSHFNEFSGINVKLKQINNNSDIFEMSSSIETRMKRDGPIRVDNFRSMSVSFSFLYILRFISIAFLSIREIDSLRCCFCLTEQKQKNNSRLIYLFLSDRAAFRYLSFLVITSSALWKWLRIILTSRKNFIEKNIKFSLTCDKNGALRNINYSLCRFIHKKQYYKRYNLDTVLHLLCYE